MFVCSSASLVNSFVIECLLFVVFVVFVVFVIFVLIFDIIFLYIGVIVIDFVVAVVVVELHLVSSSSRVVVLLVAGCGSLLGGSAVFHMGLCLCCGLLASGTCSYWDFRFDFRLFLFWGVSLGFAVGIGSEVVVG